MRSKHSDLADQLLLDARRTLEKRYLPRVTRCLGMLSDDEILWKPHPSSNSVGNLVLHLSGNVRQWIISGLGGQPDIRERDKEFTEVGPLPRRMLITRLRRTVTEASRVLARLSARDLRRQYSIQRFRVTGLEAVFHVTEHFAYHAGQIIFITKLKRGEDLGFTRLPGEKRKRTHLPSL
ncbi:MAG TPA: DUF1572 family protein [Terriglobia bacterium]|nr:DUF1572 family protein [Terriglobia bacterium]